MSESTGIPKAIRWQTLVAVVIVALIAVAAGAALAGPLRSGLAAAGHWLGFGAPQPEAAGGNDRIQYYTCGMHPWVILPKPGDCPICHMKLEPIDPAKFTGEIAIDPVVTQNIGVRVAPVVTGPLTRTIRTVGTIDYNEREVRDVNVKVSGWIEKLHVDFVGARVEAGQPLFELYSPQLYAAQEEYLLAWRNRGQAAGSADLLDAARTRLEYFDITDEQIERLQAAGKPTKTMTIDSPHTGVVIAKHANEGMKVDPGMQVFRIADLSKVWVLVTLYEYQLPYVEQGMRATMSLPYIPGQTFEGHVIYIYPYLEQKTREVQVRLEFDNPDNTLKPGMFANVTLSNTLAAEKTLAPRAAVIDTGERQVAFVSLGEGRFEPRDVRMGVETGDGQVEILSGLKPGEMVVTSGQFLIDSESKMREALAKMIRGELAAEQEAVVDVVGSSALADLPEPVADKLIQMINAYLAAGRMLFENQIGDLAEPAGRIAALAARLPDTTIPDHPHFWHEHEEVATIGGKATDLAAADDLASARLAFADLSIALEKLLRATGVPPNYEHTVQVLHCPMYRADQGGNIWLQTGSKALNPFYGADSSMPNCFDERHALPVTGQEPDAVPSDAAQPERTSADGEEANPRATGPTDDYPIDFCLVSGAPLGSMGEPVTMTYKGRKLKFCCESCISTFQDDPEAYLKKLDEAAQTLGKTGGGR